MHRFIIRRVNTDDAKHLIDLFRALSDDFSPPLADRTDINLWVEKLLKHGSGYVAESPSQALSGACFCYCNHQETKIAHLTILAVAPEARAPGLGQGLGKALFERTLRHCWQSGMRSAEGRYDSKKPRQIDFYKRHFGASEIDGGRADRYEGAIFMSIDLVKRYNTEPQS